MIPPRSVIDRRRKNKDALYFSTYSVTYGYHQPPSDKQLHAIDSLLKECDECNINYDGVLKIHNYRHCFGEASKVIQALTFKLSEFRGTKAKYYVRCRNLETGEFKTFLSPSAKYPPKGYELLGIIGIKRDVS